MLARLQRWARWLVWARLRRRRRSAAQLLQRVGRGFLARQRCELRRHALLRRQRAAEVLLCRWRFKVHLRVRKKIGSLSALRSLLERYPFVDIQNLGTQGELMAACGAVETLMTRCDEEVFLLSAKAMRLRTEEESMRSWSHNFFAAFAVCVAHREADKSQQQPALCGQGCSGSARTRAADGVEAEYLKTYMDMQESAKFQSEFCSPRHKDSKNVREFFRNTVCHPAASEEKVPDSEVGLALQGALQARSSISAPSTVTAKAALLGKSSPRSESFSPQLSNSGSVAKKTAFFEKGSPRSERASPRSEGSPRS